MLSELKDLVQKGLFTQVRPRLQQVPVYELCRN